MTLSSFFLSPDGTWNDFLTERMWAATLYDDDEVSRSQLYELLKSEVVHGPKPKASAFAEFVHSNLFLKSVPPRAVAGLVTLTFFIAAKHGQTDLSQYRATRIVEGLIKAERGEQSHPLFVSRYSSDGETVFSAMRIASDAKDIRTRFQLFIRISPLVAATISDGPDENHSHREQKAQAVLRHAATIEATVFQSFPNYFSGPRLLAPIYRGDSRSLSGRAEESAIGQFIRRSILQVS